MRIFFWALLGFLAALAFVLPIYENQLPLTLPAEFPLYRNLAMSVLFIVLMFEGLLVAGLKRKLHKQNASLSDYENLKAQHELSVKEFESIDTQLQTTREELRSLRDLRSSELTTSQEKERTSREELMGLRKALTETSKRLEKAELVETTSKGDNHNGGPFALLALLQEKGRLVDFLMDDVSKYPDAQVGAAARVVHQGCALALKECFAIQPIETKVAEGEELKLTGEFNSNEYKLVGKIPDHPPYVGKLLHKGWYSSRINLPRNINVDGDAGGVIAPAEVNLS